ncbi:DUF1990 domain-containing protein [Ornithinimicrobium pratense]|uniref:DUF1990 family protein n=1 Tax=Ornithinimicrobium pratense TaxID=2593973 RepID=UPI00192D3291
MGVIDGPAPRDFHAIHRSVLLRRRDFDAAARELLGGQMHDRAGLEMHISNDPLEAGSVVVLRLGLGRFSLRIPCRVVDVVHEPHRRGFTYGTLPGHPEAGEERFLLEQHPDGRLSFTITAYSRPATTLARVAGPLSRTAQLVMTRRYLKAMDHRSQRRGETSGFVRGPGKKAASAHRPRTTDRTNP